MGHIGLRKLNHNQYVAVLASRKLVKHYHYFCGVSQYGSSADVPNGDRDAVLKRRMTSGIVRLTGVDHLIIKASVL